MDGNAVLIASALLLAAVGALVAEVFVVSFGALALISLGLAVASVVYAFSASTALGWGFAVAAPVIGGCVLRWGLGVMGRSRLVPKAAITADAGYHHVADSIGATVGAHGTLVTAARPTGRARFAGGEADVHCDRSAEAGEEIVVDRVEGPLIHVSLHT